MTPDQAMRAQQGAALLNQRRFAEARDLLAPLAQTSPGDPDIRHLYGAALVGAGDTTGAEPELRAALEINPGHAHAAVDLGRLLAAQERHEALLAVTEAAAARERPRLALLDLRARALQALDRTAEALAVRERQVRLAPDNPVVHHNLAALLGDLGHAERAEEAARTAFSRGGDAPETWLALARALQKQTRYDEADAAFAEVLKRRPLALDALRDQAQLVWMRTGDVAAACERIDRMIVEHPDVSLLRALKAKVLTYAGDPRGAYAAMTAGPLTDAAGHLAASRAAVTFDPDKALAHARTAVALSLDMEEARRGLVEALLAAGAAREAQPLVEAMLDRKPLDQNLLAFQATLWRLLEDPRLAQLYDYEAVVRGWRIDTPDGWPDLDSYLADLARTLRGLHRLKTHPLDQSLRHGTQTSMDLLVSEEPTVRAFFRAIDGPIRRHMAMLGQGDDPLRRRNTGAYRIKGAWSVHLQPDGFHADHLHPDGWLSSACYIALPDAIEGPGREGWIRFGRPGVPTAPPLEAQHYIKPEPGLLALFPSYMWHGTVPFSGDQTRLTIAFDVVPA
ncbi:MAG: putative 2OG-Fe(II) oxygenase [Brevundimonas sp.]|uniref:putative 2OG-Fe(II) oxygenase n=1 Tax=Brevundimonas sp. TaxID=1871086 RepID=UPI003919C176